MINTIVIVAIIIYFTITILLGLYSAKMSRGSDTHDFLTAGGNVPVVINAVCIFAAFNSGGALMGNLGLSYAASWGYMNTLCAGTATGMFIAATFVAGPLRNLKIATVPEFIRKRYNLKILNVLVPIILVVTLTAYLVAQMKVGGMLGEKIMGVPYEYSVLIISAVYIFYTATGGMHAVTLTDFFQGCVMLFVLTLSCLILVGEFDGFGSLYQQAAEVRPTFVSYNADKFPWITYVGGFMGWMFVASCLPHSIMRVFTSKNEKSGRIAFGVGALLIGIFAITANVIIPAAGAIVNGGMDLGAETDYMFMTVIDALFPVWFQAVVYAGVFAAVMSSVSGMLLSIGAAVTYDLVQTVKPHWDPLKMRKWSSYVIVIVGIIAAVLAMNPPAYLTILYSSAVGVLAASLAAPLLLGLWWKRMNKWGALAGLLGGSISWMGLFLSGALPPLSMSAFAIPLSFLLCIVVSLVTPPSTEEELFRVRIAHERELTLEER